MVTNSFGNKNFMQPMGKLSMHYSKCLDLFSLSFWEGGGGVDVLHFALFPNCSLQIPK
jgi:hypothetical protein